MTATRRGPVIYAAVVAAYVGTWLGLHVIGNVWAAIAIYKGAVVVVLIARRPAGLSGQLRSGWARGPIALLSVSTLLGGLSILVLWPWARQGELVLGDALSRLGLGGVSWWLFCIYLVTFHPLLEESYWRCLIAPRSIGPSVLDAAFAGYHAIALTLYLRPWAVALGVVAIFITSWGWRWSVHRWGGLGVAIGSHAVADLSIVIAATILRS